jgi:hypothetical protein
MPEVFYIERVRAWQFPGLAAYDPAAVPPWLAGNTNFREVRDKSNVLLIVGIAIASSPATTGIIQPDAGDWIVGYPDTQLVVVDEDQFDLCYSPVVLPPPITRVL